MPDAFQLEIVVAAEPQRVFSAWMDAREHAAFTGGGEAVIESWSGGRFTAWDGYIHGILLGVEEPRRIVQTWRTTEFPPEVRDSRVAVEFEPARGGTRVIVRHSDLPPSQAKKYEKGWLDHYLKPLAKYFAKGGKPVPAALAPATSWGRREEPRPRPAPAARRKTVKPRKPAKAHKPAKVRKPARRAAPRRKTASKRRR